MKEVLLNSWFNTTANFEIYWQELVALCFSCRRFSKGQCSRWCATLDKKFKIESWLQPSSRHYRLSGCEHQPSPSKLPARALPCSSGDRHTVSTAGTSLLEW